MTKIGLVLSGGGARGIAHLGVIKSLEEHGIQLHAISGTSAGAIVGSLYCQGYSPDDLLKIIKDASVLKYLRPAFNFTGFIKMDGLGEILEKYFKVDSFETLEKPLTVAATNIGLGKTTYFSSGGLVKPVLASSCIPVIFNPIEIDGAKYVDGGITNNFPVEPLIDDHDIIIGSHTNFIGSQFKSVNMKAMLERTMLIAISGNVYPKEPKCDLFIDPPGLANYTGFDLRRIQEIFEIGYEYTNQTLKKDGPLLRRLLS